MNRLGEVGHPDVQAAIQTVKTRCAQKSIPVGIFTQNPDTIAAEIASGTRFITVGTDASFIWQSGKAVVAATYRRNEADRDSLRIFP